MSHENDPQIDFIAREAGGDARVAEFLRRREEAVDQIVATNMNYPGRKDTEQDVRLRSNYRGFASGARELKDQKGIEQPAPSVTAEEILALEEPR